MNITIKLACLACLFVLSGCSPHPGAGNWVSTSDNSLKLAKLVVHFEGRAEFLTEEDVELARCFWGAEESNILRFECTTAQDTDNQLAYRLVVDNDMATLSAAEKIVAQLKRVAE